jgi:acetyl-CoA carboxylase biotin carboxyl carrier protein
MGRRKPARAEKAAPGAWSLAEVVELVTRNNLAEIEVEGGGVRIRVVRERPPAASPAPLLAPPVPARQERPIAEEVATTLVTVEAPMVGTFYRAPSPDAAPFISEGDTVKEGQVLCIIEAMKLMNEIEARAAGRVAKVLVENGQPVEYGQALFLVDPHR